MKLLSPKQLEFILDSTAKWNIAHGSVRCGKTYATLFRFLQAVDQCPDSDIWMTGYTSSSIYDNAIRLIFECPLFEIFRPFCTWKPGDGILLYKDKKIGTVGASNQGAIGAIQGKTYSLVYCDEMTLYPESIINMIDTRLSKSHSMGFASMNPSHPTHPLKKWIDKANEGNPDYYALHFTLDDNPYVDESYKHRIRSSLSGVFYKRNYLGLWCLAEGAIFDFFDRSVYVRRKPPRGADYYVAGIDYGTANAFACVLMGVNTGHKEQLGVSRWFEKEYVWNSKDRGRQKVNAEYAEDVVEFLEPYGVRAVYVDPSAASFKLELRRRGLPVFDADNDVSNGLMFMTSEMQQGNLLIMESCPTLIKEIEGYCWDVKKAEKGEDAPIKKNDHQIDASRYVSYTHKVAPYQPYAHNPVKYMTNRFGPTNFPT